MAWGANSPANLAASARSLGTVTRDKIRQGIQQVTRGKPQVHVLVAPHRKFVTVGMDGDLVYVQATVGLKAKL